MARDLQLEALKEICRELHTLNRTLDKHEERLAAIDRDLQLIRASERRPKSRYDELPIDFIPLVSSKLADDLR